MELFRVENDVTGLVEYVVGADMRQVAAFIEKDRGVAPRSVTRIDGLVRTLDAEGNGSSH
jgi:hypothetical protein